MSSPSAYQVPLSATYPPSARHAPGYRRTDYYNGNDVRITESCRRSPVLSSPRPSAHSIHTLPSAPQKYRWSSSPRSPKASPQQQPLPSTSSSGHPSRNSQVTPRSSQASKPKGQVVIVQGAVSVSVGLGKRDVTIDLMTPPPTPKMGRLPTPELDDLVEVPFCDCCVGVQAVRYCTGCGCMLTALKN